MAAALLNTCCERCSNSRRCLRGDKGWFIDIGLQRLHDIDGIITSGQGGTQPRIKLQNELQALHSMAFEVTKRLTACSSASRIPRYASRGCFDTLPNLATFSWSLQRPQRPQQVGSLLQARCSFESPCLDRIRSRVSAVLHCCTTTMRYGRTLWVSFLKHRPRSLSEPVTLPSPSVYGTCRHTAPHIQLMIDHIFRVQEVRVTRPYSTKATVNNRPSTLSGFELPALETLELDVTHFKKHNGLLTKVISGLPKFIRSLACATLLCSSVRLAYPFDATTLTTLIPSLRMYATRLPRPVSSDRNKMTLTR
jgi:hypothetical protein